MRSLKTVAALAVIALLGACAYMSEIIAPAAQPFVNAAVAISVAKAVGANPATEKVRAAKIKLIAQQLLAANSSVTTTVATLEMDLNAKIIALNLPPADLEAAELLAASLEAALQGYIATTPKGQVVASTELAVSDICTAVITAAGAYGV